MNAVINHDILKAATMTAEDQKIAESGVCPRCHTKTLDEKHRSEDMSFTQCNRCQHVWVLPHNT